MNHKYKPGAIAIVNHSTDATKYIGQKVIIRNRYCAAGKFWYNIEMIYNGKVIKFRQTSLDLIE
jgi:hypothetical protein